MSKAARAVLAVLVATALAGWNVRAADTGGAAADGAVSAPANGTAQPAADAKTAEGVEQKAQLPLKISVELRGSYTDNRDSTPDKQSTYDLWVSPRIAFGFTDERWTLEMAYAPGLRYRSDPSDVQNEINVFHSVLGNIDLVATPEVRFRLHEAFEYTDDPAVDKSGVTVREDRSYTRNVLEGGFNWRFARFTALDLYGRNMIKTYQKDVPANDSDRDSTEIGLSLWRQVTRTVGLQPVLRATSYGYKSEGSVDRDFDLYLLALRTEKKLNPDFVGSVTLGYSMTEYSDSTLDSKADPYGEIEVHGKALRNLDLNAALIHGVRESDVYPFASQDYDEFHARAKWDASQDIALGLTGAYRLSKYDGDAAPAGATYTAATSGDETTIVAGIDATFRLGPYSAITLAQTYEDVNSDVYLDFTKNTTSVALTATF
jgi:hypothetical protein